ncbi:hypothetical protein ACOME3_001302 [Neoechinorhynchus agilis]
MENVIDEHVYNIAEYSDFSRYMNRLFGQRKSTGNESTLGDCVSNLDARADTISQKIDKLNADLKKLSDQISRLPSTSPARQLLRKRAATILRQRKQYEQQLEQLRAQSFNIDQQRMMIDTVRDSKATVDAMKVGVKQMKKQMKTDEMEDYMLEADDIQEALSRQHGTMDIDERELEAELELIAQEMVVDGTGIEEDNTTVGEELARAPLVPHREPQRREPKQQVELDEFGLPILPSSHN